MKLCGNNFQGEVLLALLADAPGHSKYKAEALSDTPKAKHIPLITRTCSLKIKLVSVNMHHPQHQVALPPPHPIRQLLLPHRFSWWGWNWDQIMAAGLADRNRPFNFGPFPLVAPTTVSQQQVNARAIHAGIPQLRFNNLIEMPVSTRADSHTSIADSVQNLVDDNQLHFVKVSNELWTALVNFAVGPTPSAHPGQAPPADPGFFNTFRADHFPVPMPTLEQQKRSISSLWGWFITQLTSRNVLVNCELAVQDEIYRQLLFPVNQLLVVWT